MGIFRRRPLFLWCAVLTAAVAVGFFQFGCNLFPTSHAAAILGWSLMATSLAGLGIGIVCLVRQNRRAALVTMIATALALLGLWQSFAYFGNQSMSRYAEGQTVTVCGVAVERPVAGGQLTTFSLELYTVDGRAADGLATMVCYYPSAIRVGDIVEMPATVISMETAAGDGYSAYALRGDGYVLALEVTDEEAECVVGRDTDNVRVCMGKLRRTLAYRLEEAVGEDASGLPSALLLGDKSHLTDAVRRDFARTGVSHLLAISGLHMTLLFGLLEVFLRLVRISRRVRAVILSVMAVGYLLLLGFPPSATRAIIMLGFVYLSTLLSVRADPLTSLGVAGVLILACTPYAAADAGFWMSYLATLGILAFSPWLQGLSARWQGTADAHPLLARLKARVLRVGGGLAVGVIAMSFTLSVVAAVIGEMGILSPVVTLLLTPLCGAVLVLSLILLPTAYTDVGTAIARLVSAICSLMTDLTAYLSDFRWSAVSLTHPLILPLAVLMTAALFVLLILHLPPRRRWMTVLPLLVGWLAIGGVLGIASLTDGDTPDVSYLEPSSQSDMLVLVEGRDAVICDMANGSYSSLRAASLEASRRGSTEIAALVLTHYHRSQSGALYDLFGRETVRALWVPHPITADDYNYLSGCLHIAERAGVPVVMYEPGERMRVFGDCELAVHKTFIDRSVQPILLLTLDTDTAPDRGGELVYCAASVFESDLGDTAAAEIASADAVIFGKHGPLVKTPFGAHLTYAEGVRIVLSADDDVRMHFSPASVPESAELWAGQWRFSWDSE